MAKGWLFLGRNKQSKTEAVNVDNGALEVKTVGNIVADAYYTWGWVNGTGTGATNLRGETTDWRMAKGANEKTLALTETGVNLSSAQIGYDHLNYTSFEGGIDTWVGIPLAASGYRSFRVNMQGNLDVDCNISAYLHPEIDGLLNGQNIAMGLLSQTILNNEIFSGSSFQFGNKGFDPLDYNTWPSGFLVVRISPATIPTSGSIRLGIERQK